MAGLLGTSDLSLPVGLRYRKPASLWLWLEQALFLSLSLFPLHPCFPSLPIQNMLLWDDAKGGHCILWRSRELMAQEGRNKQTNKQTKPLKNVFLKSHLFHAWKTSHRVERKAESFRVRFKVTLQTSGSGFVSHRGLAITDSQYPERIPLHFLGFQPLHPISSKFISNCLCDIVQYKITSRCGERKKKKKKSACHEQGFWWINLLASTHSFRTCSFATHAFIRSCVCYSLIHPPTGTSGICVVSTSVWATAGHCFRLAHLNLI